MTSSTMPPESTAALSTAALVVHAAGGELTPDTITLAPLKDVEVEIEVACCAICHSDLHLVDDDWGISHFPLVAGHEIVGKIVELGSQAKAAGRLRLGDIVGVGWQCGSCHRCEQCLAGKEELCVGGKRRTAVDQPGGFARRVRAEHEFVLKIPPELPLTAAAPLFCAGLTVFTPLTRLINRQRMKVGIVGLGGLGHLAVQIAKALGAEVHVFDPVAAKAEEAKHLGATAFYTLIDDAKTPLDVVLTTTSADLDWDAWLQKLKLGGTLCLVGVPKAPLTIKADHLLDGEKNVTGSVIGSPATMAALLAFAVRHGIRPKVETFPWQEGQRAMARVRAGDVRYRAVLTF